MQLWWVWRWAVFRIFGHVLDVLVEMGVDICGTTGCFGAVFGAVDVIGRSPKHHTGMEHGMHAIWTGYR